MYKQYSFYGKQSYLYPINQVVLGLVLTILLDIDDVQESGGRAVPEKQPNCVLWFQSVCC
jgi:hypothetical protein